jgi:hypothetical protein
MAIFDPGRGVGLRNVGSYQISGHPFLTGGILTTGDEVLIPFHFVTKNLTVHVSGGSGGNEVKYRVHFNASSDGRVMENNHYWPLTIGDTVTFHTKCRKVFITCVDDGGLADSGFVLAANLTGIGTGSMYHLTGAGLTD